METKQELIFEDDAGYLHTMIVESENEDKKTVTGWTTIYRDGERRREKVTVPEHRIERAQPLVVLTDGQKIQKAIGFLQWMHDNCLAPDITAHDNVSTCRMCRLIAELEAPNGQS